MNEHIETVKVVITPKATLKTLTIVNSSDYMITIDFLYA